MATLRGWYQDPDWQAMLLCPWLKLEETFRLCDVYTRLEIESVISRKVVSIRHYTELFKGSDTCGGVRNKGSRILIQGIPGIGKTTFTHKLALDWARGDFGLFDIVFVAKLRELEPTKTVAKTVVQQMPIAAESAITEGTINRYLTQCDENVLLILDGLDEIDLKKYPQVKGILVGDEYKACCVLATSRPHISPAIKRYMTCVANITGFSNRSAEDYASHIIPDDATRNQFFKQLTDRKMQGMYRVPIILQALALLFTAQRKLPNTYTSTYDDLVLYLQKTCEVSKGLSSEQIEEAMNLVNQLAFKGLTQQVVQLVFPREEISHENMFKLGILSGCNAVTGFIPTSSVEFVHKTVQEYSTAGHVTRQLKLGNPAPWYAIKKMYTESFSLNTDPSTPLAERQRSRQTLQRRRTAFDTAVVDPAEADDRAVILNSAGQNWVSALLKRTTSKEAAVKRLFKFVLDRGFLDDDPDMALLWEAAKSFPATQSFSDDQRSVSFDYFIKEVILPADREQKNKLRERVHKIVHTNNTEARKFALVLQMVARWMNNDPRGSVELLTMVVQKLVSAGDTVAFQSVATSEQWLQDEANSMKILFRFIMGKLPTDLATQILVEITEMLVEHAFDSDSGGVMSIHFLKQYVYDLISEARLSPDDASGALYSSDQPGLEATSISAPAIVHIKNSLSIDIRPSHIASNALSLEQIQGSLIPIVNVVRSMKNLTVLELHNISASVLNPQECLTFAEALSSSSTVLSLFLDQVDDVALCSDILTLLPASTRRLAIREVARTKTYHFPQSVNLQCLYIEKSLSGVTHLFAAAFPELRTLSIMSRFKWTVKDIQALHEAVTKGRMPSLQHLCIRFCNLSNHGKYLIDVMERPFLETVDLMDTSLSKRDGQLLLAALENDSLPNIQSLNLLHNPAINSLVPDILKIGSQLGMDIQCTRTSQANRSGCFLALNVALKSVPRCACGATRKR